LAPQPLHPPYLRVLHVKPAVFGWILRFSQ